MPYDANKNELEILEFWQKNNIFEKSVEQRPEDKPYVFYDGPPFATGLPHYGHIVASLEKDVVPRYQTMKGNRVERIWGWDCHGLPIENIIEKELNLKTRKDIEKYGIDKFNQACHGAVLRYAEEWKKTINRMGRWVDMENDYKTMDLSFMESVWWVFKQLWDRKLIYEGYKSMHICPRCVTPLSNFEVTQGYKDVKDISVVAKFKLINAKEKLNIDGDVYALAWTTTPWTLPGNLLLAVGKDIEYAAITISEGREVTKGIVGSLEHFKSNGGETYIFAKEYFGKIDEEYLCGKGYSFAEIHNDLLKYYSDEKTKKAILKKYGVRVFKGKDLVNLKYEPLFPYFSNTDNAFRVVSGDEFVTTEEGTGIVHIAPAFGEDDYILGQKENVKPVQHVTMEGKFIDEVTDFAGMSVKPKDDPTSADVEIIKWLDKNGKLFSKQKYEHSYPHCWRCDTPLLNYLTSSWFVKVTELKKDLLKNNDKISWVPENVKYGRFGKWLEGARDWAISRNRYWGAPLPIWRSEDGDILCIGSVKELEDLSGQKVEDLHKHIVDKIEIKKDGKTYKRISEVLDCWFESGSMPYGQMHYPFENKEKFEKSFPADFIAEAQDQTRGWFYTLHVLATALTQKNNPAIKAKGTQPAFKNVIVHGIVLAEDGKKMSKKLKNYPEPDVILKKYGADAMRYYLVSSPVLMGESLNFSEEGVREMYNKLVNTLWNVVAFYKMFSSEQVGKLASQSENVLDKWILAKLNLLVKEITKYMDEYKLAHASRPIVDFILDLSQWYVRRSRDRFKKQSSIFNLQSSKEDLEKDFQCAFITLHQVLLTLSKIMAPFTPFIAEKIYRELRTQGHKDTKEESVHLEKWPKADKNLIDSELLEDMKMVRKITEMGHALRKEAGIPVRQPLSRLQIPECRIEGKGLFNLIEDELNVKVVDSQLEVIIDNGVEKIMEGTQDTFRVVLDTKITDQLKKEGLVREIIRTANQMRKEQKLTRHDTIALEYSTDDEMLNQIFEEFKDEIKKGVIADDLKIGKDGEEIEIDDRKIKLAVLKK